MLVINLTAVTGATSALAFTTEYNTNTGIVAKNSEILIKVPGIYEVSGTVTATSTASGTYGVSIMANGESMSNSSINLAAVSGEETTLPVYGAVKVKSSDEEGYATLTIVPVNTTTIVGGTVSVKRIV